MGMPWDKLVEEKKEASALRRAPNVAAGQAKKKKTKEDKSAAIVAAAAKGAMVDARFFNRLFFEKAKKSNARHGTPLTKRTRVKFVCKEGKANKKGNGGKVYKFCAADDATRDRWMNAIEIATGGASGAHSPVVVVVESDLTVDRPLTSLQTVKVVHNGIAIGYDVTDQEPQPEPEPEPQQEPVGLSADASASVSAVSNPLSQAAAFEVEDSVQPSAEALTTAQSDAQPQVAAHVEDDA